MGEAARKSTRPDELKAFLVDLARSEGFDVARVVRANAITDRPRNALREFVAKGYHATMAWMAETADRRGHPRSLWPDVRSILILGMNYGPDSDPLEVLERRSHASISVYARHRDYHDVIKGRLKSIAGRFAARTGAEVKVFVDTAPVMEKPLAEKAGVGWQGKHTNLVSRDFGSWLFLGSIFTAVDLPPDEPATDACGSCRACLDICPTSAFPAPYQLDAGRCISYLTIEHSGPIPVEFREAIGNRIYGCDDCLAVCPWNKFANTAREAKLQARDDLNAPRLADLAALTDPAFRKLFSGSPIKRIGRNRFVRNVLIACGNSRDPELVSPCETLLDDASPEVRGAAVWALSRLVSSDRMQRLADRMEKDPAVIAEWRHATGHTSKPH